MPRTPQPNTVEPGSWDFQARCPECKATVVIPITLGARLTVDTEGGTVRMKVSQQPAEHNCKQPELASINDRQLELVDDADDDQDEPELDEPIDDEPEF